MSEASGAQTMSMLVELEQQEAALLWADLVRFKKGTKRVQRLKLLAFQGLLWERGMVGPEPLTTAVATPADSRSVARGIFDAPLED